MSNYHSGYSNAVIKLLDELKDKRKLVDIIDCVHDLTKCFLKTYSIPIGAIFTEFDTDVKAGNFDQFSKIQIKKVYKVLGRFDDSSEEKNKLVEKLKKSMPSKKGSDSRNIDEFLIELRQKLTRCIEKSKADINFTEEYFDGFNAYYVKLFKSNNKESFGIIVIQGKTLTYYSHVTDRKLPINIQRSNKGLNVLVKFISKDILHFTNK